MEVAIILFIIFAPTIIFLILYFRQKKKNKELEKRAITLQERVFSLEKYDGILEIDKEIGQKKYEADKIEKDAQSRAKAIIDEAQNQAKSTKDNAESTASKILVSAQNELSSAREQKKSILAQAKEKANELSEKSHSLYEASQREAMHLIDDAKLKAKEIAGDAYIIKERADHYTSIAAAMLNKIQGYGNEYIIPGRTVLDDLADDYSYSDAANDYKSIETQIDNMIKNRTAATCEYVEPNRKNTAIDFVVDAFNGKIATILSKVKVDNYGILKQQLNDAFILVNHNGDAFRNARITHEYWKLCLEKLRLATILYEMKEKEKEEQRAIREQMREEERARREIEKAIRDAAKQEELLQKAMEKAREKYETANEEQKAKYESQLVELQEKLKEAEERNKRAQSMAELTKSGHVYIISNIGSFGENIYKIGMTRRLEPLDRVRELGDASVPFPFDVHAMIWSEDAPALETSLHKHFALNQVNKINFRKEFFNVPIKTIREEIEKFGVKNISWTMTAEAREYHETLALEKQMSENETIRDSWLSREKKEYEPVAIGADSEE